MTVEIDQRLGLVPESTQTVPKTSKIRIAAGLDGRTFAQGQFNWQLFLDRNRQIQFVVPGPVDDSETAVTDHRLNGEVAQDGASRQSVAPLVVRVRHRVVSGPLASQGPMAAGRRLQELLHPHDQVPSLPAGPNCSSQIGELSRHAERVERDQANRWQLAGQSLPPINVVSVLILAHAMRAFLMWPQLWMRRSTSCKDRSGMCCAVSSFCFSERWRRDSG